jgi:hypothetical protein
MSEALAKIGLDPTTGLVMLAMLTVFFIAAKASLKSNNIDQHH